MKIDGMAPKIGERDYGQRFLVRRLQDDRRRNACLERFTPPPGTDAPAIARLQSGKACGRYRSNEIVAARAFEVEELTRHPRADDMDADVVRIGVAAAVAIEARARRVRAQRKRTAENVLRFERHRARSRFRPF